MRCPKRRASHSLSVLVRVAKGNAVYFLELTQKHDDPCFRCLYYSSGNPLCFDPFRTLYFQYPVRFQHFKFVGFRHSSMQGKLYGQLLPGVTSFRCFVIFIISHGKYHMKSSFVIISMDISHCLSSSESTLSASQLFFATRSAFFFYIFCFAPSASAYLPFSFEVLYLLLLSTSVRPGDLAVICNLVVLCKSQVICARARDRHFKEFQTKIQDGSRVWALCTYSGQRLLSSTFSRYLIFCHDLKLSLYSTYWYSISTWNL